MAFVLYAPIGLLPPTPLHLGALSKEIGQMNEYHPLLDYAFKITHAVRRDYLLAPSYMPSLRLQSC